MSEKPARPAIVREARPNGQWKVDGKEPLNANEVWKQADGGLNVRERVEKYYSKHGFDSIFPTDKNGRLRWWGLYTQRKPGVDGGKTALLEDSDLEDKFFMMRVRVDGGRLTTHQLREIADISINNGRGTADISDRQNIQMHWIDIKDVPTIWKRLEAIGLDSTDACGDVPRIILGSPVAGIAKDELIDVSPIIADIKERFVGNPELQNLPRKFKSAITGHPSLDVVHEINDVSFVAVEHPEFGVGFDLWVGGGLSTNPHLAERLGVWVAPERVAETWHGVVQIFRDYGYRRVRNKARLKFLVMDWGVEKFRQVLETEYLSSPLPDGPSVPTAKTVGDHIGVHEQKDGKFYIGAAPKVGRISGQILLDLANLLEANGSYRLSLTAHQKLVVLDIPKENVETVVKGLRALGLESEPGHFRRSTMACTGIEYCKLAIVETKGLAIESIDKLDEATKDLKLERPITLNINGCPNSCARIQIADIGLKGQLLPDGNGGQEPGFQVHLGGGLASQDREEAGLGRTVRGLKVTAANLTEYVERVTRTYASEKQGDETFAEWAHRADEEKLK
jgi:sulfite reductase (ferredoxin)